MFPHEEIEAKAKSHLFTRQTAYKVLFGTESEALKMVFNDLKEFCRAETSSFHADPRIHAVLEGRREVWLRIADHLQLNPEELWKKYGEGNL